MSTINKKSAKKPIIAIDIDDVLSPTNRAMMEFVNQTFGTNHSWDEYLQQGDYMGYWEMVWGVETDEANNRYEAFVASDVLWEIQPLEGAIECIKRLQKSFELVIVTARGDRRFEATHHWLEKHFPKVFRDVRFVPVFDADSQITKAHICKELGASYLIDDNVDHCELAVEAGLTALLFGEYGWNNHQKVSKHIIRVRNWQAVKEFFDARSNK